MSQGLNNIFLLGAFLLFIFVFIWLTLLTLAYRRERKSRQELTRSAGKADALEIITKNSKDISFLSKQLNDLILAQKRTETDLKDAIQKVGIVRFNAFDGLGGELSFAAAFLDDKGNGVVLSSIYGREESRTYVKPVLEGKSSSTLSAEEKKAISKAMGGEKL